MSKKSKTNSKTLDSIQLKRVRAISEITEFQVSSNNLRVLYAPRKGSGVVTSNIVYHIGSRDEARGETGIAHMLEHMLFKPTLFDLKRKSEPASMLFERETGIVLNANTWKDRTTYYFSYPKEYFDRAICIEAERMNGLQFSDAEFKPEQANVLSEFDMYAGDEEFTLSVQMMHAAFLSHPYGHETIGYREDIASFTTETLSAYYKKFYTPNNATITVVGDISLEEMKKSILKHFGSIKPVPNQPRKHLQEPVQEGTRTVVVRRPSTKNIYAIGVKHAGFPKKEWFETMVVFDLLAGGESSILHKELVDTGLASEVHSSLEPTMDQNLGIVSITLSTKATHEEMHNRITKIINSVNIKDIGTYLKKTIAKVIAAEIRSRENSLGYTAELVEYVSAQAWESFFESENILKSIEPRDVLQRMKLLFNEDLIVVGHFKGKQ